MVNACRSKSLRVHDIASEGWGRISSHICPVSCEQVQYARVKALLDDEEANQLLRDMYPHVMEVFGREGWDNPVMDIYNDLDPRRQS